VDIVQVYFKLPRGLQKGSSIDALNKVHDILIGKISKKYEKWLKRLVDKHIGYRGENIDYFRLFTEQGRLLMRYDDGMQKIYIDNIQVGFWDTRYKFRFDEDQALCILNYYPVFTDLLAEI
jgi:hypothetical protein